MRSLREGFWLFHISHFGTPGDRRHFRQWDSSRPYGTRARGWGLSPDCVRCGFPRVPPVAPSKMWVMTVHPRADVDVRGTAGLETRATFMHGCEPRDHE